MSVGKKRGRDAPVTLSVRDAFAAVSMREPHQAQIAAFPPSLTPLDTQVVQLRQSLPTSVVLAVVCGYKVKLYGRDSRVANRRLGIMCVPTTPFESSSFPLVRLPHYITRLVEMGYHVAYAEQVETTAIRATSAGSKTKVFERKITTMFSKATTSSSTFEALFQKQQSPVGGGDAEDGQIDDEGEQEDGNASPGAAQPQATQDSSLRFVLFLDISGEVCHYQLISFLSLVASPPQFIGCEFAERKLNELLLMSEPCEVVCTSRGAKEAETLLRRLGVSLHTGPTDTGDEDNCSIRFSGDFEALSLSSLVDQFSSRFMMDEAVLTHLRVVPSQQELLGGKWKALNIPVNSLGALHVFRDDAGYRGQPRSEGSLFGFLDRCVSKCGSRVLRRWVATPLCSETDIEERNQAVREVFTNKDLAHYCDTVTASIRGFLTDAEATLSRLTTGRATVLEVIALIQLLTRITAATTTATQTNIVNCAFIARTLGALQSSDAIAFTQHFMASISLDAKNASEAFDGEVQNLPAAIIAIRCEASEAGESLNAELTGIRATLKMPTLEYATIAAIPYLIDIPQAKAKGIPEDWIVISRTKSNVRYHTPAIVACHTRMCSARDRLAQVAEKEWQNLQLRAVSTIPQQIDGVRQAIEAVGTLDALCSLAKVAALPGYVFATVKRDQQLVICGGRHPMLDAKMGGGYVAADVEIPHHGAWLLTGPNMGGKSALMRMVGVIAIMAHIGCPVPAASCQVPLFESIFCRMGAEDSILENRSTFLVEMEETSYMLSSPTLPQSLVLMDELGQGTSSYDGLAIASATLNFLRRRGATTMFVTHHTAIANTLLEMKDSSVRCKYMAFHQDQVTADETVHAACSDTSADKIVALRRRPIRFLHVPVDGVTPSSFGVEVAAMANLPMPVIDVAAVQSVKSETQQRQREQLNALAVFLSRQ